MPVEYRIHPSIGIARLGNSPNEFYLAQIEIGGRPIECNEYGDELFENNKEELLEKTDEPKLRYVRKYKDLKGRVKRQGAKFKIFKHNADDPTDLGEEVGLGGEIKKIEWTVHLANKKAAWWEFNEYFGDLMKNEDNSYESHRQRYLKNPKKYPEVRLRNSKVKGAARKKLIIDPGSRTLNEPRKIARFNKEEAPANYRFASFPKKPLIGNQIKTLGEMRTDSRGNLVVLGGYGCSGGDEEVYGYGGADSWNDDISDGPVICRLHMTNGEVKTLHAWVIVGSPNFAPEIVNITTLDDIMFDVAVRKMNAIPLLYDYKKRDQWKEFEEKKKKELMPGWEDWKKAWYKAGKLKWSKKWLEESEEWEKKWEKIRNEKWEEWENDPERGWKYGWNPNYKANFKRDILPIMTRPAGYRWVANVPSTVDFIYPRFNVEDNSDSEDIRTKRQRYFQYWRKPGYIEAGFHRKEENPTIKHNFGDRTKAFSDDEIGKGIPLMPVNSGSNVLTDAWVDKFATISSTQYQMLKKWAKGKFITEDKHDFMIVHPLDHASVGNCVGIPMCPGIEVTWTVRNPLIYSKPYHIKHRKLDYSECGLDPEYEETKKIDENGAGGCEPGDLTKRMANPWQSDLFQCNVDYVTFKDNSDKYNREGKEIPDPPTFVAYWWPPSAPWDVICGIEDAKEQMEAGGISAGQQVRYTRGIHSVNEMVLGWSYLGFILNQNDGPDRSDYPYFVEKERNHKEFKVGGMYHKDGTPAYFDSDYNPTFHLKRKK